MIDTQDTIEIPAGLLPEAVQAAIDAGKTVLMLTGENDEAYYFEKPGQPDMNRFLATSGKGKLAQALKNLVFDKVIYPPADELQRQFRDKPGRIVALNNALQTEIGLNEDYGVKKL